MRALRSSGQEKPAAGNGDMRAPGKEELAIPIGSIRPYFCTFPHSYPYFEFSITCPCYFLYFVYNFVIRVCSRVLWLGPMLKCVRHREGRTRYFIEVVL
jgi:hypothetical protein